MRCLWYAAASDSVRTSRAFLNVQKPAAAPPDHCSAAASSLGTPWPDVRSGSTSALDPDQHEAPFLLRRSHSCMPTPTPSPRLTGGSTVEQREADRPEAPAEAEGDLGHPDSTATRSSNPGTCVVQPRHRQQVARLRFGRASRSRCGPGQSCRRARDCHAEEDAAAGAIRDHRADAGRGRCLDRGRPSEAGAVPLSEPYVGVASPFDSAVFPDRSYLGGIDWA